MMQKLLKIEISIAIKFRLNQNVSEYSNFTFATAGKFETLQFKAQSQHKTNQNSADSFSYTFSETKQFLAKLSDNQSNINQSL